MKAAVAIVRDKDDETGGLRLALKRAIEHAQQTRIRLGKLRDAVERATEHQESAAARLRDMTAAAGKAKAEFATLTAAAIAKGEPPPVATTLQDARAAETEAADQSGAAHSALAQLEQQYADLETECACADNCVATAVNALLAQPMAELLEQTKRAQAELMTCRAALQALYADLGAPKFADSVRAYSAKQARDAPLAEIRTAARDLVMVGGCIDRQAEARAAAAGERWKAARIALTIDGDAKLPEL
jgi:hypothetical protein